MSTSAYQNAFEGAGAGAAAGTSISPGLGTIIGAGIGGITSAFGASQQQSDSKKAAKKAFNRTLYMSNTANQRAADDLEKAGLNRILALGKPASSPSAQMSTPQNVAGAGVNTALQIMKQQAEISNLEAGTAKTLADTNPVNFLLSNLESLSKTLGMDPESLKNIILKQGKEFAGQLMDMLGFGEDPITNTNTAVKADSDIQKKLRRVKTETAAEKKFHETPHDNSHNKKATKKPSSNKDKSLQLFGKTGHRPSFYRDY